MALAEVAILEGDSVGALDALRRSWEKARGAGSGKTVPKILDAGARVAFAAGDDQLGLRLIGCSDAYRDAHSNFRRLRMVRLLDEPRQRAHESLGELEAKEQYEGGHQLTVEDAFSELLEIGGG